MIEVIFGVCIGIAYAIAFPNSFIKMRSKILSYFKCEHDDDQNPEPSKAPEPKVYKRGRYE